MNKVSVIGRYFKLKLGVKLCFFAMAGLAGLTFFLYAMTSKGLGDTYGKAVYTIYNLKVNIFSMLFASFHSILILGLSTAAIALIAVFYSHKIAGPVYRLEKCLERMEAGDLTVTAKFREGDQLGPIAEEMNDAVRSLNHIVRSVDDSLIAMEASEEKLREVLARESVSQKDLFDAVHRISFEAEKLAEGTAGMKFKEGR